MTFDHLLNYLQMTFAVCSIFFITRSISKNNQFSETYQKIVPVEHVVGMAFWGVTAFLAFTGLLSRIDLGKTTPIITFAAIKCFLSGLSIFAFLVISYSQVY